MRRGPTGSGERTWPDAGEVEHVDGRALADGQQDACGLDDVTGDCATGVEPVQRAGHRLPPRAYHDEEQARRSRCRSIARRGGADAPSQAFDTRSRQQAVMQGEDA